MTAPLLIGSGAGFSGDRTDAALPVVRTLIAAGGPAALIFETLAERTLALAQLARRQRPRARLRAAAGPAPDACARPVPGQRHSHHRQLRRGQPARGGAAHRHAGGAAWPRRRRAWRWWRAMTSRTTPAAPCCARIVGASFPEARFVCANAYLGARALPMPCAMARRWWSAAAWPTLPWRWAGHGALRLGLGRLGPPGRRHHGRPPARMRGPGQRRLLCRSGHEGRAGRARGRAFPSPSSTADGGIEIFKAANTGGCVDLRTVKEQLLYEVHDPGAYLTPDVVADIGAVTVTQLGPDRGGGAPSTATRAPSSSRPTCSIRAAGSPRARFPYAGPNAAARARLAADILRKRMQGLGHDAPIRFDLIGVLSVFADDAGAMLAAPQPGEACRAGRAPARRAGPRRQGGSPDAAARGQRALHLRPGRRRRRATALRARLNATSCLVPRDAVSPTHVLVA